MVATEERPLTDREQREQTLSAQVDGAIERLAEQLAAGHTEGFLSLLRFYSSFHKYSIRNTMLIMEQLPTATRVASYTTWKKVGRQVAKGEKALHVWCPVMGKTDDPDTGERIETVVAFRLGPVFDASQLADIEDNPLPSLWPPLPDDAEPLYQQMVDRIQATGITVTEQALPAGVQGASKGGAILIRPGMDSRNRLFVLCHELAHEVAHHGEEAKLLDKSTVEFQAESTAYVIAAILGFEHGTARDYVLSFGGDADMLKASLARIQSLVRRVAKILTLEDREQTNGAADDAAPLSFDIERCSC